MPWEFVITPATAAVPPGHGAATVSRCTGSIASGATTPRMRSRWAAIPNREPPFFFQKNPDNLVIDGRRFPLSRSFRGRALRDRDGRRSAKGGRDIPVDQALDHVFGYAVGLDMTRRDLQGECKKLGRPWEVGKAFEQSGALRRSCRRPKSAIRTKGAIWLEVNGERRQEGDLNQLIWKVPEMISYLSGLFTLAPGDLIMSGTPAGVGAVKRGDLMHGHVDGIGEVKAHVV